MAKWEMRLLAALLLGMLFVYSLGLAAPPEVGS